MNEELRQSLRIVGFETRLIEKEPGKPRLGYKEVDYVITAPRGFGKFTETPHRIVDVQRSTTGMWEIIEPHYESWKKGQELPEVGTPLTSWNAATKAQVEMLKSFGIRSVEDLAVLPDSGLERMQPGTRNLRDAARKWVEAAGLRDVNTALAERDAEIDELKARLSEVMSMIGHAEEPARRKPGRPRKEDQEEAA